MAQRKHRRRHKKKKVAALPAITGEQLLRLLVKDGWKYIRKATHGASVSKLIGGQRRVTVIPCKKGSLTVKTRGQILGSKQTGIGRMGLVRLIEKYGLKGD